MDDKNFEHLQDAKVGGDVFSNCCSAPVYLPDICSDCKEHCGLMQSCEKCDGMGWILVPDGPDDNVKEECPVCGGEGAIELEE